ncbi:MAG TPA: winged helix-turn-helix domain-containing protein [Gemmatimonadaceae bacterium]|nr:winged helix-turn-helix domain-containing protein [Gemmatimonadaceae bacterium]
MKRLPRQIAAVLQLLTSRPGTVITRDELRKALWPDRTVEFDQGLNFCIRQLRLALDDDSDHPAFIETLHRRGYRFIAPIDTDEPVVLTPPAPTRRHQRLSGVMAGVLALALGGLLLLGRSGSPVPTTPSLAIITFDVPPDDRALTAYSARLAEEIVTALTHTYSSQIVAMGPSFTNRFPGTRANPDSVRVALRATHLLSGTLTRSNEGIRVFAQLIRLNDRRHIMAFRQLDSSRTDNLLTVIADSIARAAATFTVRAGWR